LHLDLYTEDQNGEGVLGGLCPNCGGELVARPRRPAEKLAKYPPSTERVFKPKGCAKSVA
jgi:hypothetical protein